MPPRPLLPALQPGELRRPAAARHEPLAVAVDHGRRLPPPGLEDRRELDPRGDHVLRGADPGAVSREAVDRVVRSARSSTSRPN